MINAIVHGQELELQQPLIISDSIDYLTVEVAFGDEWAGVERFAFFQKKNSTDEPLKALITSDTSDELHGKITEDKHVNLSAGEWLFYIVGEKVVDGVSVKRIPTNSVLLRVKQSGVIGGDPFPEVTPSIGEQIVAEAVQAKNEAQAASVSAQASASIAESNAGDAEAWAVGTRNGQAVAPTDETYHNNSKYYVDFTRDAVERAETAAENADNSATFAGTMATSAQTAAESAIVAADVAEGAQTDAVAAKNAAENAQNEAQISAENAQNSATAASASAFSAQSSAQTAETARITAQTASDRAVIAETNSGNSADSASASATTATSAAASAGTSASNASQYASNAFTSAQSAQTYAQGASSSATTASTAASAAQTAASHYPYIRESDKHWMVWSVESNAFADTGIKSIGEDGYSPTVTITTITGGHRVTIRDARGDHKFDVMDGQGGGGGEGTYDHNQLTNRDAYDQHPISAITGLQEELNAKYVKPSGGISDTDLSSSVKSALAKANSALQTAPVASVNGKTGAVNLVPADLGIGSVFNLKGAKATRSQLPTSGNTAGDVWYVVDESVGYIWLNDGSTNRWEMLGMSIDLTAYRTAAAQDVIDNGKQANISDLATIRSGASAGATAVQPNALTSYQTKAISDAGSYFTTDTVEGALQQLGSKISHSDEAEEIATETVQEIPLSTVVQAVIEALPLYQGGSY